MARPPTSEAFLGHLSLWNEVWNVSRIKGLALKFPQMLWKSQIGPKTTELESVENYQLSQIRAAEALTSGHSCPRWLFTRNEIASSGCF